MLPILAKYIAMHGSVARILGRQEQERKTEPVEFIKLTTSPVRDLHYYVGSLAWPHHFFLYVEVGK